MHRLRCKRTKLKKPLIEPGTSVVTSEETKIPDKPSSLPTKGAGSETKSIEIPPGESGINPDKSCPFNSERLVRKRRHKGLLIEARPSEVKVERKSMLEKENPENLVKRGNDRTSNSPFSCQEEDNPKAAKWKHMTEELLSRPIIKESETNAFPDKQEYEDISEEVNLPISEEVRSVQSDKIRETYAKWKNLTEELLYRPITKDRSELNGFGDKQEYEDIIEGVNLPISEEVRSVQSHNPFGFQIRKTYSDGQPGATDPASLRRRRGKMERYQSVFNRK